MLKYCHLDKLSDDSQKRRTNINKAKENLYWFQLVTYEDGMKKTILYFAEKWLLGMSTYTRE